jgi:hypothetical protein
MMATVGLAAANRFTALRPVSASFRLTWSPRDSSLSATSADVASSSKPTSAVAKAAFARAMMSCFARSIALNAADFSEA